MKTTVIMTIGLCIFIYSRICLAYEPGTHQSLSDVAASASVLVQSSPATHTNILEDLGLKEYADLTQLFPNSQHGYGPFSFYMMRRRWDYFVQNLLGDTPPVNYQMHTPVYGR